MTKTRIQEELPLELPAARLFLDDLEQIIRVFRESRKYLESPDTKDEPTLKIRVGGWECDNLHDLRELGTKATKDFFLDLDDDAGFHGTFYIGQRHFIGWRDTRLSNEGKWAVYGQLRSILEKRKLRWTPWRRGLIIFENSYEYKGVIPTLRRHATTMSVAVATAILTLIATKLVEKLIGSLRRHQ